MSLGVQLYTAAHITDKEIAPESNFETLPPFFKKKKMVSLLKKVIRKKKWLLLGLQGET